MMKLLSKIKIVQLIELLKKLIFNYQIMVIFSFFD